MAPYHLGASDLRRLRMPKPKLDYVKLASALKPTNDIHAQLNTSLQTHSKAEKSLQPFRIRSNTIELHQSQTRVALIGQTGIGKSNLINALLDENSLALTSSSGACTSVPLEFAYNRSEGPAYKGTISFITKEAFIQDLEDFFGDLEDDLADQDNSYHSSGRQQSDASKIAASKLSAIFPAEDISRLTREDIPRLMQRQELNVLGSCRYLAEHDGKAFQEKLAPFVQSRAKRGSKISPPMEYWPLIECVTIFIRDPALYTGCVLVDLPGLGDKNAARVAIAKKYLEKCSAIWLLAPIVRAQDGKLTQDILCETLRRQLSLDGIIRNIAFICCKIDELEVEDIRAAYDHKASFAEKMAAIDSKLMKIHERLCSLDADLSVIDSAEPETSSDDESLVAIAKPNRKRKRLGDGSRELPKKLNFSAPRESTMLQMKNLKERLTERTKARGGADVIESSADDRERGTKLSSARRVEGISKARSQTFQDLKERFEDIEQEEWLYCVHERNKHVTADIKASFRSDFQKITKQDIGAAQSLVDIDVFCISALGYRKLNGWSSAKACYITEEEDTGILALRTHVQRIGEKSFVVDRIDYIEQVKGLILSLRLWTQGQSIGDLPGRLSSGGKEYYTKMVDDPVEDNMTSVKQAIANPRDLVQAQLLLPLHRAKDVAANQAGETARTWNRDVSHHMIYRAICRHRGEYSGSTGAYNWNSDLADLFMASIENIWVHFFTTRLPALFDRATGEVEGACGDFEKKFARALGSTGKIGRKPELLKESLSDFLASLTGILRDTQRKISVEQRSANRLPESSIRKSMRDTYVACMQERGQGMFKRMKQKVLEFAVTKSRAAYIKICEEILQKLADAIMDAASASGLAFKAASNIFQANMSHILLKMPTGFEALPRCVKRDILDTLDEADKLFAEVKGVLASLPQLEDGKASVRSRGVKVESSEWE